MKLEDWSVCVMKTAPIPFEPSCDNCKYRFLCLTHKDIFNDFIYDENETEIAWQRHKIRNYEKKQGLLEA